MCRSVVVFLNPRPDSAEKCENWARGTSTCYRYPSSMQGCGAAFMRSPPQALSYWLASISRFVVAFVFRMLRNFRDVYAGCRDGKVVLSVDGKHKLLKGDFKLVTVFLLYRSQVGRCDRTKMYFHTTHSAPVLQAICPEESAAAATFIFRSLVSTIRDNFQVDLTNRVAGVCMDDSPAFEAGRRQVLGGSVRVLDYFHVVQAQKENVHGGKNGKLRDATPPTPNDGFPSEEKKAFIKKSAHWIGKFIDKTRPLLNSFLFHLAWKLTLEKIESVRGSKLCADYMLKHRLKVNESKSGKFADFLPREALEILTFTVNGVNYCGQIDASWRSSVFTAPPMSAAGTAGAENYHRPLRADLKREQDPSKLLYELENRIYPQTTDCSALDPAPSVFPQEWSDSLLKQAQDVEKRQAAADIAKRDHGAKCEMIPSAMEYVDLYNQQESQGVNAKKRCIKTSMYTVNRHKATVYMMHK